jgi:hypothetical protein
MRKLFIASLAAACTLIAASASATRVETIALFDHAAFETPESVQVDRHGNVYVSLASTGEIRKIAPDGTRSPLALLPLHPEIQPCQNAVGAAFIAGIALDHQGNVYVGVNSCSAEDLGIWNHSSRSRTLADRASCGCTSASLGSRGRQDVGYQTAATAEIKAMHTAGPHAGGRLSSRLAFRTGTKGQLLYSIGRREADQLMTLAVTLKRLV